MQKKLIIIPLFLGLLFVSKVNALELFNINNYIQIDNSNKLWYINLDDNKKYSVDTLDDVINIFNRSGVNENTNLDQIISGGRYSDISNINDMSPFADENKIVEDKDLSNSNIDNLLSLINKERVNKNLNKLSLDNILLKTSEDYCLEVANNSEILLQSKNYHKGINGSTPKSRALLNGSKLSFVSEIMYYSKSTGNLDKITNNALSWWMDSSTHRNNILNKNFKYVGMGICQKDKASYFIVMFGY